MAVVLVSVLLWGEADDRRRVFSDIPVFNRVAAVLDVDATA